VLSATNAEPASTEDTACVELIGAAKRAETAEPEALEAWADDEDGHGLYMPLQNDEAMPLQGDASERARGHDMAPRLS
jgi:hypothetical protein